jgi:hypothetical protein
MSGTFKIHAGFPNLNEAVADLEAIRLGLGVALRDGIEEDAQPLLNEAKALTPRGPGPRAGADPESDDALPHIADSLEVRVRGGTLSLYATHPGAIVHEWGGTIAPNGAPIQIGRAQMAHRALELALPGVEQAVSDRVDRLIALHS